MAELRTLQYHSNILTGQEEGPANAPLPPTPIVGNGAYQNPITGQQAPMAGGMAGGYSPQTGQSNNPDDMENGGIPSSYGGFLRNSLAAGRNNLKNSEPFRPGSDARQGTSGLLSMVPVIGPAYMLGTGIAGKDPVAGTKLTKMQRGLNIFFGALGLFDGLGGIPDEAPAPRNCFVAGTPVQMADGTTKPIEQVRVGDVVWSRNPDTGKNEPKNVVKTFVRHAPQLVTLQLADPTTHEVVLTLRGTPEHPVFTSDHGLVNLGDLGVGSQVVTRAGPALVVASTKREAKAEGYTVYNFTVADDHTYFIGGANGGAWVHNAAYRLRPDMSAMGEHTTFFTDPATGKVTHYATWEPQTNPHNPAPWSIKLRFDGVGQAHYSDLLGQDIPTPHVHYSVGSYNWVDEVRPALPPELPNGY